MVTLLLTILIHLKALIGPYKARLTKGTIERLELKVGEGWEIQTEKIDGLWHWLEAFQDEFETA